MVVQESASWKPFSPHGMKPNYTRDPINHVVYEYRNQGMDFGPLKSETKFCNIGGLNYVGQDFKRKKGVVEFSDLTHAYRTHANRTYQEALERNRTTFHIRSTSISQFVDDAIAHHDNNPFRCGK
jgi:hypothetical protein